MKYWNEYDFGVKYRNAELFPNRSEGIEVVFRLAEWTNRNSDGWAYWTKPRRAALRLMDLLDEQDEKHYGGGSPPEDVSSADLRKAYTPIRSFLTRHGVDHAEVFGGSA